jgi:hypothetical protein
MADTNPVPLEEQKIIWIARSLSRLKILEHERIQLTRPGKSTNDPEFIEEYERYVTLQYETLEEFFKQISRYLEKHGTAKTLASQTLREIASTLMCQSCGEV